MDTSDGNRLMALTWIIRSIHTNAVDVLIGRDLVPNIWQHGRISDIIAGDFNGSKSNLPHLRRFTAPAIAADV
ncbi:MAG: hypothetical protein ABJP33_10365 [Pseudoruegeria sp.]